MIKIRFEEYWALDGQFCLFDGCGDYVELAGDATKMNIRTKRRTRTFQNIHGLARWIAKHMESGWHGSTPEFCGVIIGFTGIRPVALQWTYGNTRGIFVHEIRDTRRGILFTDGAYTKGAKYESDEFKDLIQECRDMADSCSGLRFPDAAGPKRSPASFD